jgi:hypothetical protein
VHDSEPWIYVTATEPDSDREDLRALKLGKAGITGQVHLIDPDSTLNLLRLSPDRHWLMYMEQNLATRGDCLCFVDLTREVPTPRKICNFTSNRDVWYGSWYWDKTLIASLYEFDLGTTLLATSYWQFDPAAPGAPVPIEMPPGSLYAMEVNPDGTAATLTRRADASLDNIHVGELLPDALDLDLLTTFPLNRAYGVDLSYDSEKLAVTWNDAEDRSHVTLYTRSDAGWGNGLEITGFTTSFYVVWGEHTQRLLAVERSPYQLSFVHPDGTFTSVFSGTGPLWVDSDHAVVGRGSRKPKTAPDLLLWSRIDDNGAYGNVISITEGSTDFEWVGGLTHGRDDKEIVLRAKRTGVNRLYAVDLHDATPARPRLLSGDYETSVFAFDETRDRILVSAFESPSRPLLEVTLSSPVNTPPVRLPISMEIDGTACFAPAHRGVITFASPLITPSAETTPAAWYPTPETGVALSLDQFFDAGYTVRHVFSRELGECGPVSF